MPIIEEVARLHHRSLEQGAALDDVKLERKR